ATATVIAIISKGVQRKDIADLVNGGTWFSDRERLGREATSGQEARVAKRRPRTGGAATNFHFKVRGGAMSRCAPMDHFLLIAERYDNKAFERPAGQLI